MARQQGLRQRWIGRARGIRTAGGFDFTGQMRTLCEDIAARLPALGHVDIDRVAIAFSQARKRVRHGLYATLTPMRFAGGAVTEMRGGQEYAVERLFAPDGREMLYILSFYLPRFMEETFEEKLVTIFHELWHISPQFDGDLRRHAGRCHIHSASQQKYDEQMARLVRRWLALGPPERLMRFLHDNFNALHHRHGGIYGVKIPHPKLIRV